MTALYQLTEELHGLHQLVLAGEATEQDIADTLQALEGEFNQKALSVGEFVRNLNPTIDAIDAEIKRLQERKKVINGRMDRLKEYLRENMVASGISKIDCDLFSITCRKPTKVAVVDNEAQLPDEYVQVKTSVSPDKKKILDDLKAGKDVPGAHMEDGKASIQIK